MRRREFHLSLEKLKSHFAKVKTSFSNPSARGKTQGGSVFSGIGASP